MEVRNPATAQCNPGTGLYHGESFCKDGVKVNKLSREVVDSF